MSFGIKPAAEGATRGSGSVVIHKPAPETPTKDTGAVVFFSTDLERSKPAAKAMHTAHASAAPIRRPKPHVTEEEKEQVRALLRAATSGEASVKDAVFERRRSLNPEGKLAVLPAESKANLDREQRRRKDEAESEAQKINEIVHRAEMARRLSDKAGEVDRKVYAERRRRRSKENAPTIANRV